jgi:hypothetical protein
MTKSITGGIRTHEAEAQALKACPFDRSGTVILRKPRFPYEPSSRLLLLENIQELLPTYISKHSLYSFFNELFLKYPSILIKMFQMNIRTRNFLRLLRINQPLLQTCFSIPIQIMFQNFINLFCGNFGASHINSFQSFHKYL